MNRKIKPVLQLIACLLGLWVAGEIVVRWMLQLNCYPLYVPHATIEYLLRSNQHLVCNRKTLDTNRWSMRSPNFGAQKLPGEIRIMVFGDSVTNAAYLDQSELATSLLAEDLSSCLNRQVIIGNISAPSWGVPNYLAYEKEYGFFDADVVVLVFSSHDLYDVPTFEPLSPIYQPRHRFHIVLPFGIQKLFGWFQHNGLYPFQNNTNGNLQQLKMICLDALQKFYGDVRRQGMSFLLVFHAQNDELETSEDNEFIAWAHAKGVTVVSDRQVMKKTLHGGLDPYQDFIHLNALGQSLLEAVILDGFNQMGFFNPVSRSMDTSQERSFRSSSRP